MADLRTLLTGRPDLVLTIDDDFIGSAYSPMVEVTEIEGGHEVSITSKGASGIKTDTFDVMDGVSPTVSIESTTDEHTVTITDRDGEHEYTVYTYADEERARATAESGRAGAESARVSAESARAESENGRSTAESARDEAERARSAAEATRTESEGTRVTNESARANAESARAEAEQSRARAETSREAAWDALSTQAMSATQAASNAAQTASQAASAAYSAAQSASQAESTMTANETARASAEQGRVAAEQGRVTAETSRVSAETARATEWAEIKGEAQNATTAAQAATTAANDAAALATRAAAATWNEGNVLIGTLAEGTVLTADDAYAAPPESVEVYGKSEQVQTAGKNLLSDVEADWQQMTIPNVATRWVYFIPVDANASYTYSRNATGTAGFFLGWCDDTSFTNYEGAVTLTNYQQYTVTNTTHAYLVVSITASGTTATVAQVVALVDTRECQIEQASAKTDYEPYTDGKSTPRPDYPQSIENVDALTLNVVGGKNMLDAASPKGSVAATTYTYVNDVLTVIANRAVAWSYVYYEIERPDLEGETLTLSCVPNGQDTGYQIGIEYYDSADRRIAFAATTANTSITRAVPTGTKYIRVLLYARNTQSGNVGDYATYANIQLELGDTATTYAPYVGQSITIPLSNHVGRSLPDGTRDTLTLSYIGPSEREGWGVFGAELVQNCEETIIAKGNYSSGVYDDGVMFLNVLDANKSRARGYCSHLPIGPTSGVVPETGVVWIGVNNKNVYMVHILTNLGGMTYQQFTDEWWPDNPITLVYPLATPITHDLGTVELPVNPAPDLTAWADGGSAQPTMSMVYEQDINTVIGRLRDAIADMATS